MAFHAVFKKTLQELILEVEDILNSGRYDAPELLKTDLKTASIAVAACNEEAMTDIMTTFGKFVLQFEGHIQKRNVDFFKHLEVCKGCVGSCLREHECVCNSRCGTKCKCDAKCPNCSEILRDLDSKTFNAIKYIIGQAIEDDTDPDKKEDIDVIFNFISSLLAASKNHKKR